MGRVNNDQVRSGFDKQCHPLVGVTAGADRCTHAQCASTVLAGQRVIGRFLEILGRDHSAKLEAVVYHQNFFDTMLVKQGQDFLFVSPFQHRYQLFARSHDGGYRRVELCLKAQIPVRNNSYRFATIHDWHAGNIIGSGDFNHLLNSLVRRYGDRIGDHAAFKLLDARNLTSLLGRTHVFVDYADAAFLSESNGEVSLGHRVHCSR